jgi:ATP-binding cassette subfamily G (WHITE) protein 2 (SNQ2)
MENEFKRLDLQCVGSYIVPNGAGYPATLGENQICTLAGAFLSLSSFLFRPL